MCTGALIDKDLILTSWHCVWYLRPITVGWVAQDKKSEMHARVIVFDEKNDLAILKLERNTDIHPFTINGNPKEVSEGEAIATIGHPMGVEPFKRHSLKNDHLHVFSLGVVSKVNEDKILTDLSLSPGNSGGAVFNEKGEIIGVASSKVVARGVGQIGYLTPSWKVNELKTQINEETKSNMVPFYKSENSIQINLTSNSTTYFSHLKSENSNSSTGAEFAYNLFDRIRFSYAFGSSKNINYEYWRGGYNFHFDLSNSITLKIVPLVGIENYFYLSKNWPLNSLGVSTDWFDSSLKLEFNYCQGEMGSFSRISIGINLISLFQ